MNKLITILLLFFTIVCMSQNNTKSTIKKDGDWGFRKIYQNYLPDSIIVYISIEDSPEKMMQDILDNSMVSWTVTQGGNTMYGLFYSKMDICEFVKGAKNVQARGRVLYAIYCIYDNTDKIYNYLISAKKEWK